MARSHHSSSIEFEVSGTDPKDDETEIVFTVKCTVTPYDPGKTYGPPEDCYPPEGGDVEDLEVFFPLPKDSPKGTKPTELLETDFEKHGLSLDYLNERAYEVANDKWEGESQEYDEREVERDVD